MAINLSINLNKVALLRNSRGATNPSPRVAAEACIAAGVQGLTLHWREDNRHTRVEDVHDLCQLAKDSGVEFNLEGDQREELTALALEIRPTQFTLVPVTPGEVTSDHGWDLPSQQDVVAPIMERINAAGIRSAIFMDADAENMTHAAATGTQRVEIYTEPYADAFGTPDEDKEYERLKACCVEAVAHGLGVNAGHDLDLHNMPRIGQGIPEMLEVSIGHALLADALYLGLGETISRYLKVCSGQASPAPKTC
ncbi:MAG: pyridoxine 5'-phosphate synthase [Myxococcales bacterium]|nr:pyridoxine 5'-phosphate synthase [Myxococcales bacterium]